MPSLPAVIPSTVYVDGQLVTSANLWTGVTALVAAIRARMNPKTSIWHAVYAAGTATLADATWTDMPLDTVQADTDALGIKTNGYRAPIAGRYLVSGRVAVTTSATGGRVAAAIAVNGTRNRDGVKAGMDFSGAAFTEASTGTTLTTLAAGDLVTVQGFATPQVAGLGTTIPLGRCTLTVRRYA